MTWYLIHILCLLAFAVLLVRKHRRDVACYRSQHWTALKPRRSLIPWRRWNIVTKIKLRQPRKALDQEKRAKKRSRQLVRELSRAGHAHP